MPTVAWDNQDVGQRNNDRLSFKKDKIDRICLLDQDATFALIHYIEGGYVHCTGFEFVQVTDPQTQQQKLELQKVRPCRFCEVDTKTEPQQRFASKAIIYSTDQDGVPLNPFTFKLKWWSFNQNHFRTLRSYRRQKNADIRVHDIQVTCTNEEYQHLQLQIMEEAWWVMDPKFKTMVAEAYRNCRFDLEHLLGQKIAFDKQEEYIKRKQSGGRGSRSDDRRKESQVAPPNVFAGGGPINPFGTPATTPPPAPALSAANPFVPPPASTVPTSQILLPPPPPLVSGGVAAPPAMSSAPGTPVFGAPPAPPVPELLASQALSSTVPPSQPLASPVAVTVFPKNPAATNPPPPTTDPAALLNPPPTPPPQDDAKSLDDMLAAIEHGG